MYLFDYNYFDVFYLVDSKRNLFKVDYSTFDDFVNCHLDSLNLTPCFSGKLFFTDSNDSLKAVCSFLDF